MQKDNMAEKQPFNTYQYNKYKSLYPFNDEQAFGEWLSINQLSLTDFESMFLNDNHQHSQTAQHWLRFLHNDYRAEDARTFDNPFCQLVDFILVNAQRQLSKACEPIFSMPVDCVQLTDYLPLFEQELTELLIDLITPTLTLELNVARVSNKLQGTCSEERFQWFIEQLKNPAIIQSVFDEYPLLLEQLVCLTEQSIEQHTEFLARLSRDHKALCVQFGKPGQFRRFGAQQGDAHNQGRSVRICHFENLTLVYKPRSLSVDQWFGKLLTDLNAASHVQLKSPQLLNLHSHGWTEYITEVATENDQQAGRYYHRMGHYLALLYVLNSGDFHHENIIAHGEHPVLVDLESIFHVNFKHGTEQQCDDPSLEQSFHTVLDSMMLPQKTMFAGQKQGMDVSALGFRANQRIDLPMGQLVNQRRDDMRYTASDITTSVTHLQSHDLSVGEITAHLINGFDVLYDFFLTHPDWLSDNLAFMELSQMKYRCILRPTDTYHQLVKCLQHPDFLRNQTERDLFIEEKLWVMTQSMGHLRQVIRYESACLKSANIPIFYFQPNSQQLFTGNGQVINHYFHHPALARIDHTLHRLSEQDRRAQHWLIRASMHTSEALQHSQPIDCPDIQSADDFCHHITSELLACAHQSGHILHWKNLEMINETQWTINSKKEFELFNGNLGSLLYLLAYAQVYQDADLLRKVQLTAEYLGDKLPAIRFQHIGGFVGMGGVLYSLSQIQHATGSQRLLRHLSDFSRIIEMHIDQDPHFDVMHGAAGCLLAALTAHRLTSNPAFLSVAGHCARHLRAHAVIHTSGVGWPNPIADGNMLGGFSHGVTGIAFALGQYDQYLHLNTHTDIIRRAWSFESSLFDPETLHFRDLRVSHDCCDGMFAWCNGGLGVAMASHDLQQQASLNELPHARLAQKAVDALGHNQSLCHGDASILHYLNMLTSCPEADFNKAHLHQRLDQVIQQISRTGLKNGMPFNQFDPGLMVGSPGLAYQILHIKNPQLVPNVLLLN
ncbi:type 2 lanthipeptide synthetase LanM family protein [Marinicella sediminis]|uniref:Type 2 lanthipeptide synthetase LanM family protein n=1 Tax=Marinicella sediminis TaxID=1792834 RepID=A0ABV7JAK3_9GAMM|nr:type 2 lanthipeptide synthetase LanM family protein [Marinicella sediminis]